jgi:hypothetical protein
MQRPTDHSEEQATQKRHQWNRNRKTTPDQFFPDKSTPFTYPA